MAQRASLISRKRPKALGSADQRTVFLSSRIRPRSGSLIVRISIPDRSRAREAWTVACLFASCWKPVSSLLEACKAFPRRNSRYWFKDSLGIATRGDPGGIYAPIQPLEGRPGQGRSRETSHGAALEKLC